MAVVDGAAGISLASGGRGGEVEDAAVDFRRPRLDSAVGETAEDAAELASPFELHGAEPNDGGGSAPKAATGGARERKRARVGGGERREQQGQVGGLLIEQWEAGGAGHGVRGGAPRRHGSTVKLLWRQDDGGF